MARSTKSSRDRGDGQIVDVQIAAPEDLTVRDDEQQQNLDMRRIKGKFHFYERPGGTHNFVYRRYADEKILTYRLRDQGYYELPWGVVRALEEGAYYWTHNIEVDGNATDHEVIVGGMQQVATKRKGLPRYAFMPIAG
jgi:hypothetical protein